MTATRRLAAILAADVAGYSRLMGANEEGTHERLQAHFGEFVNPKIGSTGASAGGTPQWSVAEHFGPASRSWKCRREGSSVVAR